MVTHHRATSRLGSVVAMALRSYSDVDLAAIHSINQSEVPAVGTETPEALAHIADQSVIALVAEDDATGVVAGFCLVLAPGADYDSGNYRWFSDRYDDFVYLDRIAIAPAFRRRGLGRALYGEVEQLASTRRATATQFTLEVNLRPRNDTSLAFHTELGFVEVGQRETGSGTIVSLMAKSL